jgi:signal transduction histidine kinase
VFGALLRYYFYENQSASRALSAVNETLEQAVRSRTAELSDLSQHLLTIRDEERAALARDIHDQIGSELAALRMDCARLERADTGHNPLAKSTWPRIRAALDELTQAHRRIIKSLHPTVLDHLGLEAAIRELLKERLRGERLEHHLSVEGSMQDLPADVAIAAYRVVQESLSNVLKHAKATQVSIVVRRHASMLTVDVSEDGVGVEAGAADKGRLGLVGMRERAHKLGGSFHIGQGPAGTGTRVTARFRVEPKAASSAAKASEAVGRTTERR